MRIRIRLAFPLVLSAVAGCAGGGGDSPSDGSPEPKPVVIDGSSTVFRISKAAQEHFSEKMPDIDVVVGNSGTGGGFGKYNSGEVDIVDASRPAKPEEEATAKQKGFDWIRYLVGYDGITVVVNPKNDWVKSLSVEQLKKLWSPDSKVKTWKNLDPSWPDRAIELYGPDRDSGTFEFFTEAIVGKAKSQRDDVQMSADDNVLVTGVAGDPDALGYFGYAYAAANADKVKIVPIRASPDAEPVAPSLATILDKSYTPLSRPLFIYAKKAAMHRPEVSTFMVYYLDNIEMLAREGGYVPPTEEDQAENKKAMYFAGSTLNADKKPAGP